MKIYVTRHGETEWNINREVSGITDIPLTDKGRAQAAEMGEGLVGLGIELVITSTLGRAVETGAIAAGILGVPTEADPRLMERNFGVREGAPYDDEDFKWENRQFAFRPEGGESIIDVCRRLYSFLDELLQKHPGKTVLLVTHGAAFRALNTYFESLDNETFWRFATRNCQVREYELES